MNFVKVISRCGDDLFVQVLQIVKRVWMIKIISLITDACGCGEIFLCVTKYFCPYLIYLGDGLPALRDPGDEGGGGGRGEVLPRLADELRHGDDPRHRAVSSLLALTKYFYALRKKYFLCVSLSTAAAATRSTVHVGSPAVSAPLTLHTPHSLRAAALAPPPRRAGHSTAAHLSAGRL